VAFPSNQPNFLPNLLDWTVNRPDRTFHAYVVEPCKYEPAAHSDIFDAAINYFIERRLERLDPYVQDAAAALPLRFDLVTFPEAFLPIERLIAVLSYVGRAERFGCVHVGLRPSAADPNHLFSVSALKKSVHKIRNIPDLVGADLDAFESWLDAQEKHALFNVGCLFTVDSSQQVRVCLHPKMVQSKFESGPLHEQNMEEANLLTVVTLRPTDKKLKTIVVQPLLCSDALQLDTKRAGSRPLQALQLDADCLGDNPPDHVDIVSVATCTPQVPGPSSKAPQYRIWHHEFRKTFELAAFDDSFGRHHFATFVLSNFQMISADEPGGLSGAFIPVPVLRKRFPEYVALSCYGKPPDSEENRWSRPDEDCVADVQWKTRGYIAALSPFSGKPESIARMFGFTVHKLLRDQSLWNTNRGLTDCILRVNEAVGGQFSL